MKQEDKLIETLFKDNLQCTKIEYYCFHKNIRNINEYVKHNNLYLDLDMNLVSIQAFKFKNNSDHNIISISNSKIRCLRLYDCNNLMIIYNFYELSTLIIYESCKNVPNISSLQSLLVLNIYCKTNNIKYFGNLIELGKIVTHDHIYIYGIHLLKYLLFHTDKKNLSYNKTQIKKLNKFMKIKKRDCINTTYCFIF